MRCTSGHRAAAPFEGRHKTSRRKAKSGPPTVAGPCAACAGSSRVFGPSVREFPCGCPPPLSARRPQGRYTLCHARRRRARGPGAAPLARVLRVGGPCRVGRRDGRHAAGPDPGARPHHRAAPRRAAARPGCLRAAESLGHPHRGWLRRRRPRRRSLRQPDRPHRDGARPRRRRLPHESGRHVRRPGADGDTDARPRTERAVGRQPRDDRPVVRPADRRGDGGLQRGDERRLHDRVSAGGIAGAELGLA